MNRRVLFVHIFLVSESALAQGIPSPPEGGKNIVSGQGVAAANEAFSTLQYAFGLTLIMALTGLIVIAILVLSLRKIPSVTASDISRPIIVVTVIVGTLILITAGYSNTQIAPAFGLFGTIIGYILGRSSTLHAGEQQSPESSDVSKKKDAANLIKGGGTP